MKKDIAVLMPAYNPGDEIIETLNSLRKQTEPFKLFVIDDGSAQTPDYDSLLKGFDYHLIVSPRNLGVNEARNPALQQILSEGFPYIALIDCGDIALPKRLTVQKAYLEANPDIAILGSWTELIFTETGQQFVTKYPAGLTANLRTMWSKLPTPHPTLMMRSEVFRRIGLYSARFEAAEDYEMIRRAAAAGFGIDNVQEVLLHKIETRNSISWKKRGAQLKSRLAIQWQFRDLTNIHCIAGLLRTSIIRVTPAKIIRNLKYALNKA